MRKLEVKYKQLKHKELRYKQKHKHSGKLYEHVDEMPADAIKIT